ncbi:MAG: adenylate/guanylate cyclase domain-containing protein [Nanoarchaeota archaeon]
MIPLGIIVTILVLLVLVYAVVKLRNMYKDSDNIVWIVALSIAVLIATDTWISFYGQNVRAFFDKYRYLFTFIPLVVFLGYMWLDRKHRKEESEKQKIKAAFKQYLTPALIDEILRDPSKLKLGGTRRNTTIMFSDIRGFTTLSESLTPEELVHFINNYLTAMTDIILERRGTVDKYIGDAIMAFWNAPVDEPAHIELACNAALENVEALDTVELPAVFKEKNLPRPAMGIGLNTGEVVVGNVGSEQRFNYTALGDHVNLASRLESLTKHYGVHIIVSDSTYQIVKSKVFVRTLDNVAVKGKKQPVKIHELLRRPKEKHDLLFYTTWEDAIVKYNEKDFVGAQKLFGKCEELRPHDKVTKLYLARCVEFRKSPPGKDWDGVFVAKEK